MITSDDFPRLKPENYRITSPECLDYNCVAWSANDTEHWWQPGVYWPIQPHQDDYGIAVLESAFKALGYEDCRMNGACEPEFEKVALFGDSLYYTHAARQLPNGKWTSKLGKGPDIEHDNADDVGGGVYGEIEEIMKRPLRRP
jgi:hypothetical protein